jgi:hypothetical protein
MTSGRRRMALRIAKEHAASRVKRKDRETARKALDEYLAKLAEQTAMIQQGRYLRLHPFGTITT